MQNGFSNPHGFFAALSKKHNLSSFVQASFHRVNPSTRYLHNWHIDMISDHLTLCERGEIKRLIINMPPRYMKSISVSVAWPAWLLGHDPTRRIVVASYAEKLAIKHSQDTRLVMAADWYRAIFPQTILQVGQNEKHKFVTSQRGFRLASSVGGALTGEGGNFLIVDDPHNPTDTHSDTKRNATLEWFDQIFSSRLDYKKAGVIVVVMQRLHHQDLTAHLMDKTGQSWQQLVIPVQADKAYHYLDYAMLEGDFLHPEREGRVEIERLKTELGSHHFAAQYLQQPTPLDGSMIKRNWLSHVADEAAEYGRVIQSWDTAIKVGKANDYSVCATIGERDGGYDVLDIFMKRMEYPETKQRIVERAEAWKVQAILIEDKASGQSLIQDIKRDTQLPIIGINPTKDKVTRFAAVTPLFEAGKVRLPKVARWKEAFMQELLQFPASAHDDQVDAVSQGLRWLQQHNGRDSGQIRRV